MSYGRTCSAFERRSPRARSWPCDEDAIRPLANGAKLAVLANGELVTMEGSGHAPHVRDPVKVNLLLRDFIGRSRP
jgi:pimeloyl-ACP methyl ester carboxylesterase